MGLHSPGWASRWASSLGEITASNGPGWPRQASGGLKPLLRIVHRPHLDPIATRNPDLLTCTGNRVSASREKWKDVDKYIGLMDQLGAGSPEVLVTAAEIAFTWGERKRAAMYLEKAEALSPRHPLLLKLRRRMGK